MKRFLILFLLLLPAVLTEAADLKIKADKDASPKVSRYVWGNLEEVEVTPGKEGYTVRLEKGWMYAVSVGFITRAVYADGNDIRVTVGKMTVELEARKGMNGALAAWYKASEEIRTQACDYYLLPRVVDTLGFRKLYAAVPAARDRILKTYGKGLNAEEYELLDEFMKYESNMFLGRYVVNPGTRYSTSSLPAWIRQEVLGMKLTSDLFVTHYPDAMLYLHVYADMYAGCRRAEVGLKEIFGTDNLKALYALSQEQGAKTYEAFQSIDKVWGRYFTSSELLRNREKISDDLQRLRVGAKGFDFALPDVEGKTVRFSDLKGKVVLVDLWATWCGPCKHQLPYLKKLKKEMEGTDLVVVGISCDSKNEAGWKHMAPTIGGIQLLDKDDMVGRYYKCNAIPRFMIFDREGRIVTLDAMRPSDSRLKVYLEKLL